MLTDNISFQSLFKAKRDVLYVCQLFLLGDKVTHETVKKHHRVDFPFLICMGLQPQLVHTSSHH